MFVCVLLMLIELVGILRCGVVWCGVCSDVLRLLRYVKLGWNLMKNMM